ncbi:hypothetical protein DOTSEDRAFT_85691 [Dothistroma septosporum NZE10]|uniref:BD-FAE-like domain-containing protein n=1 Tax=Dothistroma septosporum (strain NZE10 / CBS 128990) TaxID=675120 RepID=N1PUT1_DOTSN|nr:hypothetical protein DOTSEDRAFT_85691 [Dothistroma septosporum NZE10]
MDQLPSFGTAISDVIGPTLETYEPLLIQNASKIRSLSSETHKYGPHPRQQLDVYHTPTPKLINRRQTHYGYSTVIPDYRLVHQHDAVFPSGGEDLVVEWIVKNAETLGAEGVDLFIMGNSAGGVHLSTFLLCERFAGTRRKVLGDVGRVRLKDRAEVLETYFGGDHVGKSPLGLLRSARGRGSLDILKSKMRVFVLNGELDPEDEIMKPRDAFVAEWEKIGTKESRMALAVDTMRGQNHVSPFCSLGTGIERGEAWGHQVGTFRDDIRKTTP